MIIGISGKLKSGKDEVGGIIRFLTSPEYEDGWNNYLNWKEAVGEYYSGIWCNVKFADKLKDMVCLLLGCTRKQLEDQVFKETPLGEKWWYFKKDGILLDYNEHKSYGLEFDDTFILIKPTPRLILQQMGTEGGRDLIHPNMWINATMANYKLNPKTEYPFWLITDLRFPNELKEIQQIGGITIRVERPFRNRFPEFGYFAEVKDKDPELYEKLIHFSETALDSNDRFDYIIQNDGDINHLISQIKEILIKHKAVIPSKIKYIS